MYLLTFIYLFFTLSGQPEQEIKHTFDEFITAFRDRDSERVLQYISSEKTATMLLGTKLIRGIEIRDYYNSTIDNLTHVDELTIQNITISMISKDMALLHCEFKEVLTIKDHRESYEGAALYLFRKINSKWSIQHSSGSVKCQ